MRIVIFGAGGTVGQRVVLEAIGRGHEVVGASRKAPASSLPGAVRAVLADARDPAAVAAVVTGADAVVCAIGPRPDEDPMELVRATEGLIGESRRPVSNDWWS